MPFKKKCASESLHQEWGCAEDSPLTSRLPALSRHKLLHLSGKSMAVNYTKSLPKFCLQCVEKVSALVDSKTADSPHEHSPDSEPPSKMKKVPPDIDEHDEMTELTAVPASECSEQSSDSVSELPFQVKNVLPSISDLDETAQMKLAFELGKYQKEKSKQYAFKASMDKSLDTLLSFEANKCHAENSAIIQAFLSGLMNRSPETSSEQPSTSSSTSHGYHGYQMCKTVESILNLSAVNLVLPAHFRESVILYTLTGSKLALQMLGSGGAHASYQSVKSWLDGLATTPPEVPEGDIVIGFDNNQVLQRRWKVRLRNEVKCNIVTIIVSFLIRRNGDLEHQAHLKRESWWDTPLGENQLRKLKYIDQDETVKQNHYGHLYMYLHEQIQLVAAEQEHAAGTNRFSDNIDKQVTKQEHDLHFKKCYNCSFEDVPRNKHSCPQCKANVTKAKMRAVGLDQSGNTLEQVPTTSVKEMEYKVHVVKGRSDRWKIGLKKEKLTSEPENEEHGSAHRVTAEKPTVNVLEPVYMNPCSYEAVATVLRNIGEKVGIAEYGGARQWVPVVCDGVPFTLCRRILASMYFCKKCEISLEGKEACLKHQADTHTDDEEGFDIFRKEFDWALLQPGVGHIEMNMVKGVVELGWEVFWKNLAICLNFRSETALNCAKKVTDHHKGWTMLRIARESLTRELLVPFVRQELAREHPKLDVANLFKSVMMAKDPNYSFIADFTFELLDAVIMYRTGVRCNIPGYIEAGRGKFAKVWCGRNHPLYRELEMADTLCQLRMPEELKMFIQEATSLNLSDHPDRGEGVDFRLEEVNKQVQKWLPNVPSTKDWQTACSNFDQLNLLRETIFQQMDVKDPKYQNTKSVQNIDDEVEAFRTQLRKQEYLVHPDEDRTHVSLDGIPLDSDLKSFCELAREKRAQYMDIFLQHDAQSAMKKPAPPSFKVHPVFVTSEERQQYLAIENRSVADIKALVLDNIRKLTDSDVREVMQTVWAELIKPVNKPSKNKILDFYYELKEYINALDSQQEMISDDEQ